VSCDRKIELAEKNDTNKNEISQRMFGADPYTKFKGSPLSRLKLKLNSMA
jgi:hypothetical protein